MMKSRSSSKNSDDDKKKKKGMSLSVCLRIFLFLFILLGAMFSIATLAACNFIYYDASFPVAEDQRSQFPITQLTNGTFITSADLGFIRWAPEKLSCTRYEDSKELSTAFEVARATSFIAAIAGLVAMVFVMIELVCIRYYCSRTIVLLALVVALLSQLLTFAAYGSDYCVSVEDYPYTCDTNTGTYYSVTATIFYFISLIFVCCAPKDKPVLRVLIEMDLASNENTDPCCYCCQKKPKKEEEEEEEKEEVDEEEQKEIEPEPAKTVPPPVVVPPPPVSEMTTDSYPAEVYASTSSVVSAATPATTLPSGYLNAEVDGSDLFFDAQTVS